MSASAGPATRGAYYPKASPSAARTDSWPPTGGPPGSDLAFLREQLLDAWPIDMRHPQHRSTHPAISSGNMTRRWRRRSTTGRSRNGSSRSRGCGPRWWCPATTATSPQRRWSGRAAIGASSRSCSRYAPASRWGSAATGRCTRPPSTQPADRHPLWRRQRVSDHRRGLAILLHRRSCGDGPELPGAADQPGL